MGGEEKPAPRAIRNSSPTKYRQQDLPLAKFNAFHCNTSENPKSLKDIFRLYSPLVLHVSGYLLFSVWYGACGLS
jgi:hypothetical protein